MGLLYVERHSKKLSFGGKCVVGALLITTVEFVVGCVVNKIMGLRVWDYSDRALNIMGQICPLFTVMWFIICIPAFLICGGVNRMIGDIHEEE